MKVTGHLVVSKGYSRVITASQWLNEVLESCREYNEEYYGSDYHLKPKDRAVITVEFEVPDSLLIRNQNLP